MPTCTPVSSPAGSGSFLPDMLLLGAVLLAAALALADTDTAAAAGDTNLSLRCKRCPSPEGWELAELPGSWRGEGWSGIAVILAAERPLAAAVGGHGVGGVYSVLS